MVPDASPAPDALREIIRQEIEPWLADRHDRFGWGDYPLMAEEIDEHLDAIMVKVSNRVKVLAKQSEERKELIYQESVRAQKAEARVKVLEEALREISKRLHYSDTTYESGPVEVHRHLCELMEIADAALASMTGDEVRVPQGQEIRAVGGHTGTSNPVVVTGFAGKEEKK